MRSYLLTSLAAGVVAAMLAPPLSQPAAAQSSCRSQIAQADRYLGTLRPGPNTREAERHLQAARAARSERQCAAELRQVDRYARLSAATDRRTRGAGYGSSRAPVACADLLHQNRPGGSDYHGPPVPGCRR